MIFLKRIHIALAIMSFCIISGLPSALAIKQPREVSQIVIESAVASDLKLTLALTFDSAVEKSEADNIRNKFSAEPAVLALASDRLTCGKHLDRSDSNGSWTLQYQCFPEYAVLNWGYRLSAQNQASVVGTVNERGLSWWRNGAKQPQNAPHPAFPANYLFHGTMKKVWNGDTIDYQDYLTWRHNIGPGGTAAVTFAGSVGTG